MKKQDTQKAKKIDSDCENLKGNVSKNTKSTSFKLYTKDPQRLFEKTWITVQFGLNVFKYKHPFKKNIPSI